MFSSFLHCEDLVPQITDEMDAQTADLEVQFKAEIAELNDR